MRIGASYTSTSSQSGNLTFLLHTDPGPAKYPATLLEGAGMSLTRINDKVTFMNVGWPVHGDILATAAILLFAPWVEEYVTFEFACSHHCIARLSEMQFYRLNDGKYKSIPPVTFQAREYCERFCPGKGAVIAYGGGHDSTAVALLFPEASLASSCDSTAEGDVLSKLMQKLGRTPGTSAFLMPSTLRELTVEKARFPCYAACMVPALLSLDHKEYIMLGSDMADCFLSNGGKYIDSHLPKYENRWCGLLRKIGVQVFSPLAGSNIILNARICADGGLGDAAYCFGAPDGSCCHKCQKCFRKNLAIYAALGATDAKLQSSQYWGGYSERVVRSALAIPEGWYDAFAYIFNDQSPLPTGLVDAHSFVCNSVGKWAAPRNDSWVRYFGNGIMMIPEEIRAEYLKRILSVAELMTDDEHNWITSFNATERKNASLEPKPFSCTQPET